MMAEKLIIRAAKRNETATIIKFIKALAFFEKLKTDVIVNETDIIKNIFDNHYANVLFLEVKTEVIGFAVYFYTFSTFLGNPAFT